MDTATMEDTMEIHLKTMNHTIPLGRPSALAPSIQYCASNLDWQLVSYMIFYMETYITMYNTDSQQEFSVWLRKLKEVLCINLEAWDGKEDGNELENGGDICIPMADSC